MIPVITGAGGAVLVKAEVESLVLDRGRIAGVRMAGDGTETYAPLTISAVVSSPIPPSVP